MGSLGLTGRDFTLLSFTAGERQALEREVLAGGESLPRVSRDVRSPWLSNGCCSKEDVSDAGKSCAPQGSARECWDSSWERQQLNWSQFKWKPPVLLQITVSKGQVQMCEAAAIADLRRAAEPGEKAGRRNGVLLKSGLR